MISMESKKRRMVMDDIKITEIYSLHRFDTPSTRWSSWSPRPYHFLSFQKEGLATHILENGEIIEAVPDTVLFLNRNDSYKVDIQRFGYSIVAEIAADNAPDSFIVDCSGDSKMSGLFTALLNARNDNLQSNRYRALGLIYEIFGLISRRQEAEYMTSSAEGRLFAVRVYIQEHYSDPSLDMNALASISGVSAHQLSGLFRKKFGVSVWQYVIDTRIDAASKLLRSPGFSVGMVAEQCGFRDVYYFSRLFKKQMGVSPREYRSIK